MTRLPEHLGNMSMQRHMALIIKLVLASQDEARMKERPDVCLRTSDYFQNQIGIHSQQASAKMYLLM